MKSQADRDGGAVLMTGASSGLGLETAIHLAERGFRVFAALRDLGRKARLETAVARRNVRLDTLQLDVCDDASIRRAVDEVIGRSGGIYALINNAGVQLRGYFEDLSDAEIRRVFEVNVLGTMNVTRAVLPHMRQAHRGRILIVTSIGGLIGSLALSAYCASKFALEGLGESLWLELGPLGIQTILIEPAIIETEIWTSHRGVAERAGSPDSPYREWFHESERLADRLVRSSPTSPRDVAVAVEKALTTQQPRLRYLVGRRASFLLTMRRLLPSDLFERFYFRKLVRLVTKFPAPGQPGAPGGLSIRGLR